jgi:hypothetical protein
VRQKSKKSNQSDRRNKILKTAGVLGVSLGTIATAQSVKAFMRGDKKKGIRKALIGFGSTAAGVASMKKAGMSKPVRKQVARNARKKK